MIHGVYPVPASLPANCLTLFKTTVLLKSPNFSMHERGNLLVQDRIAVFVKNLG